MKYAFPVAVAAVLTVVTAAQADHFSGVYGNTVTRTMADGTKVIIYVNEDKTWEQHVGTVVMKGTYAWKDDTHACFTVVDPAPKDPSMATNCIEIKDDRKAGDTWTEPGPGGHDMTMSITAGR